jgi:hypothetical protein
MKSPAVLAALLLGVSLSPGAAAQSADPDQARAQELVSRIRKSMREIDSLLLKGSQPEKIERELAANQKRIEDLLDETEQKSQLVIKSIDELVDLSQKGG